MPLHSRLAVIAALTPILACQDGTIEWTTPESAEKFVAEGQACLIWNVLEAQQEEKLAARNPELRA